MNIKGIYKKLKMQTGSLLITALVFTFIFIILAGGLLGLFVQEKKVQLQRKAKALALEIAEAGINYYKWHLDNFNDDYADGNGPALCNINPPYTCGPYVHNYDDPIGGTIGQFELYITPPETNSTIVKIKSTGWTLANPNIKRITGVRYGRPSWAKYSIISNSNIRIGALTTVRGPMHSNGGIRFDGIAYNEITSAQNTYNDTDGDACTLLSWGVHTCSAPPDPSPPTAPPNRNDIFTIGRRFPVPVINFDGVTADLGKLQSAAQTDGLYIGKSNRQGWHIQFQGSNLQYRKVKTTNICTWAGGTQSAPIGDIAEYQGNWVSSNFPNNGIIFIEDNVWLDGTLNSGAYITLVAAKEPLATENADVWINNDIAYAVKDGTIAFGIIAQNNISVGLYSEDDLIIDAVLLAQKGRAGRFYYPSSCSATYYKRTNIQDYGSIASNQRYGFSWVCGGVWCSGYQTRNIIFDSNMTYSPPPLFPNTGEYTQVSWEEFMPGEVF